MNQEELPWCNRDVSCHSCSISLRAWPVSQVISKHSLNALLEVTNLSGLLLRSMSRESIAPLNPQPSLLQISDIATLHNSRKKQKSWEFCKVLCCHLIESTVLKYIFAAIYECFSAVIWLKLGWTKAPLQSFEQPYSIPPSWMSMDLRNRALVLLWF